MNMFIWAWMKPTMRVGEYIDGNRGTSRRRWMVHKTIFQGTVPKEDNNW